MTAKCRRPGARRAGGMRHRRGGRGSRSGFAARSSASPCTARSGTASGSRAMGRPSRSDRHVVRSPPSSSWRAPAQPLVGPRHQVGHTGQQGSRTVTRGAAPGVLAGRPGRASQGQWPPAERHDDPLEVEGHVEAGQRRGRRELHRGDVLQRPRPATARWPTASTRCSTPPIRAGDVRARPSSAAARTAAARTTVDQHDDREQAGPRREQQVGAGTAGP
jgi:hypothetical protein